MHLCASKINAGICVSLSLSFTALHVIGIKCVRVTVGAIGQSVRRGGMRFVAFVQNRISSCCSCRFEMCFLSPHVQEQVLVLVFLSSGEFGAGIVARAGGALSPLLFIGGDWGIRRS